VACLSIFAQTTGPEFVAKELRQLARAGRLLNPLHRAGKSLEERLLRKLQRTAQGRMPERRTLPFT
jgi:hypothetical protein